VQRSGPADDRRILGKAGGDRVTPQRRLAVPEELAERLPALAARDVGQDAEVEEPVVDVRPDRARGRR
jgi:hypothetical protein